MQLQENCRQFFNVSSIVEVQTKCDFLILLETGDLFGFLGHRELEFSLHLQKSKTGFFYMAVEKLKKIHSFIIEIIYNIQPFNWNGLNYISRTSTATKGKI